MHTYLDAGESQRGRAGAADLNVHVRCGRTASRTGRGRRSTFQPRIRGRTSTAAHHSAADSDAGPGPAVRAVASQRFILQREILTVCYSYRCTPNTARAHPRAFLAASIYFARFDYVHTLSFAK